LTSDRWGTLLAVVPQALVLSVVEVLGALARGQPSRAAAGAAAWPSNLLRLPSLVAARRQVARFRTVSDREVARHQVRGLLGPRLAVRHLPGSRGAVAARGVTAVPVRGRMEADPAAWSPNTALVAAVLAGVLLVGSRHLLTRFVPAVGQLVPPGGGAGDLLAAWAGGWRTVGLGAEAATPDVAAALGLAGGALLGHVGTARTWLVLGLVPVGVVGAHRLLAPARSRRAQVAAAVAYAAVPLPYEALARGRWGDLAAYAAAPWLLARLARASGVPPFAAPSPAGPLGPLRGTGEVAGEGGRPDGGGPDHGAPGGDVAGHPLWQHVVATGTVTGAAGVLVPQAPLLVLLAGAGLVLGSLLVGEVRGCGRVAVAAAGGATVGAALLLPTALDVVTAPHGLERWLGGDDAGRGLAVPDVAASGAGAGGWRWAALAVAGAAAVPVLVGRRWRLGWAVRGWVVGLLAGGLVWAGGQGWLEVRQPDPGVVLAPGAAGLALAVGLGLSAVERDVAGRSARLGVRRLVAVVGLAALCASTTGVVAAAADGWWGMPRDDHAGVLRSVDGVVRSGPSRVLWVGDDDLVPGGAGWPLGHHLVYTAATGRAVPGVADLWPATGDGASERLGATLSRAMDEGTTRLGAALAPEAVLFVAVPRSLAPSDHVVPDPAADRAAASLEVVLASQLDLEEVYDDRGLVVYRNTAALPLRTAAPAGRRGRPVPVLGGDAERGATGPVPGRVTVVQASTASARWQLRVGGRRADHGTADGWADAFAVERGGEATLAYRTAASVRLLRAMQVLLWLLAVAVAVRMRFGTATAPDHAPAGALGGSPGEAAPEAPAPLALPRAGAEPAGRPPAVPVADG
ncbi:MAG TPA: hypothetical protein VFW63_02740, partial [Acidimicrobiales bacterium]|nr:hypothetical protein [Acidimicrobiales bacterium]